MKAFSPGASQLKEKFEPKAKGRTRPIDRLYETAETRPSSITVTALLFFILINMLLLAIDRICNISAPNKDNTLVKLQQAVFDSSYETNLCGPWPWWAARAYFGNAAAKFSPPDIAIFGDSQANAAIDQADAIASNKPVDCAHDRDCLALKNSLAKHLKRKDLRLVNLSIGGAMPSDYYLMTKTLFIKHQHPRLVIITISPRSFLDATLPSASSTEAFHFFAPFTNLEGLTNYAFDNPLQKWLWLIQRKMVIFSYRQNLSLMLHSSMQHYLNNLFPQQYKHFSQNPSTGLESIYSSNGIISLGSSVIAPIQTLPFRENKKEYARRFAEIKPRTLSGQSTFFVETLKYLQEIKAPTLVIEMPVLPPVKALLPHGFWEKYRSQLQNNCLATHAQWLDLDAPAEFPRAEFIDYVHLNAIGGIHFVNRITNFIQQNNDLMARLQ